MTIHSLLVLNAMDQVVHRQLAENRLRLFVHPDTRRVEDLEKVVSDSPTACHVSEIHLQAQSIPNRLVPARETDLIVDLISYQPCRTCFLI